MDTILTPPLSKEIVQWLSANFPDRLPPADTHPQEFAAKAGEQRVIRFVRAAFERQTAENVFPETEDSTQ